MNESNHSRPSSFGPKRIGLLLLALLLIAALTIPTQWGGGQAAASAPQPEYDLALFIGSPLTLSGGETKPLDSANLNVAPLVYRDRTLVPLRTISEHFGAQVSYDAASKAAIIRKGNESFTFYAGKSYCDKASPGSAPVRIVLDTEMLIRENRSMVPLRVISEGLLNKKVSYRAGLIVIGKDTIDLAKEASFAEAVKGRIGQAVKVTSRAQLEKELSATLKRYHRPEVRALGSIEPTVLEMSAPGAAGRASADEAAAAPAEIAKSSESSSNHSTTNLQVDGIDEADIVKTDGTFIYVAGGNAVRIYRADGAAVALADTIALPRDPSSGHSLITDELYIDKGRLVVLAHTWGNASSCFVYSVDARGAASLLKEVSIEGSLLSSRKNGDVVTLVANQYVYGWWPDIPEIITPVIKDSAVSSSFRPMETDKIMCYPGSSQPQYLIIASIDIRNTEQAANIEAILGSGTAMYMNDRHLYIAQETYKDAQGPMTSITRYALDGIQFGFSGGALIPGYLLNQFAMDEYQGNLRVATTEWSKAVTTNSVYVLDRNMNIQGSLTGLAPDEQIFAVRFMGDQGYVVTFRQVDPLFVLDLSDPAKPVVTGELKIPGFSNFLYPVGESLLLGVGESTEPAGIKFSLFDVSDRGRPRELHHYILQGDGTYSDILHNHKALMFYAEKGLLAFDATIQDSAIPGSPMPLLPDAGLSNPAEGGSSYGSFRSPAYFSGAILLEFSKAEGFREKDRIPYSGSSAVYDSTGAYLGDPVRRLCYIGQYLYYVQGDRIQAYRL